MFRLNKLPSTTNGKILGDRGNPRNKFISVEYTATEDHNHQNTFKDNKNQQYTVKLPFNEKLKENLESHIQKFIVVSQFLKSG